MIEPQPKTPLLPSDRIRIQRFGALSEPPAIYIFADIIDELMLQATYRRDPCAAMLTGGFYTGPAGLFTEIQGFSESTYLDATRDLLGVFARRHRPLREGLAREGHQKILGWSHGVPGCEGKLTREALRIHLTFFNLPFQVVLMLDPDSGKIGLYRRGAEGQMENIGFNLIAAAATAKPATEPASEPVAETVATPIVEAVSEPVAEAEPVAPEPATEHTVEALPEVEAEAEPLDLEGGWMEMSSEGGGWLEIPGDLGSLPSIEPEVGTPTPAEPLETEAPPEGEPGEEREPRQGADKGDDHDQD